MSVKNPKDARRKMKDERRKTEDARCKMQDERHHSHSSYSPIALFLTQEAEGKNSGCLVHDMAQLVANPTRVVYNYYLVPLVSRNHHGKTTIFHSPYCLQYCIVVITIIRERTTLGGTL